MLIFEDKNSLGKLINVKKYSDMMKLFRITAYVIRFINNIKSIFQEKDCQDSHLTGSEIRDAHNWWIEVNQSHLRRNLEYTGVETQLNCKVDGDGIICSYGRMKYANIPEQAKAPIMLSKEHHLSTLIVIYYH